MRTCRGWAGANLSRVLGLGKVPAAQHFPLATELVRSEGSSNPLAMDLCIRCWLAQLAHDGNTVTARLRRMGVASTAGEGTAR
jgi:hypothetical protein